MVAALLIGETLLMSYRLDTLFGQAASASRETSAEDVVVHTDEQVSVRVTPTKTSLCFVRSTLIVLLEDISSREAPPINPEQWNSWLGVN